MARMFGRDINGILALVVAGKIARARRSLVRSATPPPSPHTSHTLWPDVCVRRPRMRTLACVCVSAHEQTAPLRPGPVISMRARTQRAVVCTYAVRYDGALGSKTQRSAYGKSESGALPQHCGREKPASRRHRCGCACVRERASERMSEPAGGGPM